MSSPYDSKSTILGEEIPCMNTIAWVDAHIQVREEVESCNKLMQSYDIPLVLLNSLI